jgi:hypothetical protein
MEMFIISFYRQMHSKDRYIGINFIFVVSGNIEEKYFNELNSFGNDFFGLFNAWLHEAFI